jgi:hypothetical protein
MQFQVPKHKRNCRKLAIPLCAVGYDSEVRNMKKHNLRHFVFSGTNEIQNCLKLLFLPCPFSVSTNTITLHNFVVFPSSLE